MVNTRSGKFTFNPKTHLWESTKQSEMENLPPSIATSLGNVLPSNPNLGVPNVQEPQQPFHNNNPNVNDDEVYQDEDPIDFGDISSEVKTFLADPYNVEMMDKSIKANKTDIFLNLIKDGVNVPTSFDENVLFNQVKKGGAPLAPNSNTMPTSSKGKEPTVTTSAMPTSSTLPPPTFQANSEIFQQFFNALSNFATYTNAPQNIPTTSNVGGLGISQTSTQPMVVSTQPTPSPQLHVPTTTVTTSVPNATSTYQQGGSNGTTPPPQ